MAIMLPDPIPQFLQAIGINWPDINEDHVREFGDHVTTFGQNLSDTHSDATQTLKQMGEVYKGASSDAMSKSWTKMTDDHMTTMVDGCSLLGTMLGVGADVIIGMKVAAIVELAIDAASFIAAQIAAPFTFGLSEAVVPLLEEAGEQIVNFLVGQLISYAEDKIVSAAMDPLEETITAAVAGMVFTGSADAAPGAQFQIDPDELDSLAAKMGGHAEEAAQHAKTFESSTAGLTFDS